MNQALQNRNQRSYRAILFLIARSALIALMLSAYPVWAKPHTGALPAPTPAAVPGRVDTLGKVNFPTSCAPRVQSQIEEGVALLHSFQYRQAKNTFTGVSKQEPHCAIAYWGQAMSLYEQLWDWPDAKQFAEGRKDIDTAEKQKAVTPHERAYLDVARLFYQKNPEWDQDTRMKAFSDAWEKVYRQFPDDTEAAAFYALSLVALAEEGVDETANRKRAIAVLDPLFRANPDDPGPAHYLIHAADTPDLAPQALDAARRYASIAPDSSHALHMPAHIFVRLGLWPEAIESNLAAAKAAAEATRTGRADMHYQVHAMDFLDYAYLQAGDQAAARQVTEDLKNVVGASAQQVADHQADFRARAALELHQWKEAESLPVPSSQPRWQETTYWVRTIGAARNGDVAEAQKDLAKLQESISAQADKSKKKGPSSGDDDTRVQEAQAWVTFAQGKVEDAVKMLRTAADADDALEVEAISMPAREMLADMLLQAKRSPEALHEYEFTLRESPNRFDALYGAAHAAESAGRAEDARKYFAKLVASSIPSADRPELQEARTYIAAN
jgi:tetratricopeptide (TPR) repeat protein